MAFDSIFLCIYVVEAALKITALGFKYFSDPWNNLGAHARVCACVRACLREPVCVRAQARVCVRACVCADGASGLLVEAEDERGLAGRAGVGGTGGLGEALGQEPVTPSAPCALRLLHHDHGHAGLPALSVQLLLLRLPPKRLPDLQGFQELAGPEGHPGPAEAQVSGTRAAHPCVGTPWEWGTKRLWTPAPFREASCHRLRSVIFQRGPSSPRSLGKQGPAVGVSVPAAGHGFPPALVLSASLSPSAHSFLTSLQEVTGTLVRSLPSITAILILMFTCLCILGRGGWGGSLRCCDGRVCGSRSGWDPASLLWP